MSTPASRPRVGTEADRGFVTDAGWLEWLSAHAETAWRPGEWDGSLWAVHRRFGQRPDSCVAVSYSGLPHARPRL